MDEISRIIRQYQRQVFTFACYFLGNREDAEEVTQDVLVTVWRRSEELCDGSLPGWVTRVTRNACVDRFRSSRRRKQRIVVEDSEEISDTYAGSEPMPDEWAERSEFRARLQQALSELKEPLRTTVILREIQDKSYGEISETMDIPINTVKVNLYRARRRLRILLGEYTEEGTDGPK